MKEFLKTWSGHIVLIIFACFTFYMMALAVDMQAKIMACEGKLHTLIHTSGQQQTLWGCRLELHENNYHQLRWYLDGNPTTYDTNWALKSN